MSRLTLYPSPFLCKTFSLIFLLENMHFLEDSERTVNIVLNNTS